MTSGAERFRQIISELIAAPSLRVPESNIQIIDSRMWDPVWRQTYGTAYTRLFQSLNFGFQDRGKAYTVASGESYYWGRGAEPTPVLTAFAGMTPDKVYKRIRRWYGNLGRGVDLPDMIIMFFRQIGNPNQYYYRDLADISE